jgi:microcin-processing metallopeptidase PmbA/TldD-like protein
MKTLRIASLVIALAGAALAQAPASNSSTTDDVIMTALKQELGRAKEKLQLGTQQKPYFIQYSVNDSDDYVSSSVYGAQVNRVHTHLRTLTVVVRVGDYNSDSDLGSGEGVYEPLPVDDDVYALRRAIWLATDRAYKYALESFTEKQAALKQFEEEQSVADFSREAPVTHIEDKVRVDTDIEGWEKALSKATALYRKYPELDELTGGMRLSANNFYLVNSEGSMLRMGQGAQSIALLASAQAADGMRLRRSLIRSAREAKALPSFVQFQQLSEEMVNTLRLLRTAPVVKDEYRGPVLFSNDSAGSLLESVLARNFIGNRPQPGNPARVMGAYASSWHSQVLPEHVSLTDDPMIDSIAGRQLLGTYAFDDEGVQAGPVKLVENGILQSYLLARRPIKDFPKSNGHGRNLGPFTGVSPANLILKSSAPTAAAEMKQHLIDLCKQRGLEYGYYAATMAGPHDPRLLYRVWAKDGREELVRGAVLDEIDTRAFRNELHFIGDDLLASNNSDRLPTSYVAPSLLFNEIVVKPSTASLDKLPQYPAPPLGAN